MIVKTIFSKWPLLDLFVYFKTTTQLKRLINLMMINLVSGAGIQAQHLVIISLLP